MERPAGATFLCFERPEAKVYLIRQVKSKAKVPKALTTEADLAPQAKTYLKLKTVVSEERVLLGRAALPFSLAGKKAVIYDSQGKPLYQIYGPSLQCQLQLFSLGCGPCKEAVFAIDEFHANLAEPKGQIFKTWSDCFKLCCSTAPWYVIDYPKESDWKARVLIVAALQLLDQHYFSGLCQ